MAGRLARALSFPVVLKIFPDHANFSLLFCVGNSERNGCGSAISSLLAGNFAGDGRDQHCIASQAVRPSCQYPEGWEKGPPTAGFCIWPPVSRLPFRLFGGPNRRKSPAVFENIPVFRRLRPQTWFERPLPGEGGSYARNPFFYFSRSPDWRG